MLLMTATVSGWMVERLTSPPPRRLQKSWMLTVILRVVMCGTIAVKPS